MDLHLHDKVELKKAHPCGSTQWEILRVGMDIKLKCLGCGHELMLPRSKAEKSIRKILTKEQKNHAGHRPGAGGGHDCGPGGLHDRALHLINTKRK